MSSDRVLKIPELVSLIGQRLDQHDFTVCIRVCHNWFDVFTPLLYHAIAVYEFDLYSHKFEGATSRTHRSLKNASLASIDEDPGYGGSMVHKYAHLIHSIASPNIHALTYLGEQAVNLTHVAVRRSSINDVLYRPLYADNTEKLAWSQYWAEIQDHELIISTWVALINRNPGLKSVHIDLCQCSSGTERIIHALAKCEQLEEVYLSSMIEPNTLEMMLDHCPQILSLSTTCGPQITTRVPYVGHQTFKAEPMGNVGASTKIRHLNIHTHEPWIPHVLRRCPDLLSLILPSVEMDMFTVLAQEVITLSLSKFFFLRSLELTLGASSIKPHKILPATLLNSCSASLTALIITDTFRHDFGQVVIPNIDSLVWSRLEEFRYTGWDFDKHKTPSYQLCRILALCPKLRVFEISKTMITASEVLTTPFVCGQTLASLKLTVCSDHIPIVQTHQSPTWPQPSIPFTAQEIQMATMAQFELPITLPPPAQQPHWPQHPYMPPPPLSPTPSYFPADPASFQLATMAQFELPMTSILPEAQPQQPPAPEPAINTPPFFNNFGNDTNLPPHQHPSQLVYLSREEINTRPTKICLRIISSFPQLRQLEYGSQMHSGTRWHYLYPIGHHGENNEDCVRMFQEGLPRLQSLVVQGVSCQ